MSRNYKKVLIKLLNTVACFHMIVRNRYNLQKQRPEFLGKDMSANKHKIE